MEKLTVENGNLEVFVGSEECSIHTERFSVGYVTQPKLNLCYNCTAVADIKLYPSKRISFKNTFNENEHSEYPGNIYAIHEITNGI